MSRKKNPKRHSNLGKNRSVPPMKNARLSMTGNNEKPDKNIDQLISQSVAKAHGKANPNAVSQSTGIYADIYNDLTTKGIPSEAAERFAYDAAMHYYRKMTDMALEIAKSAAIGNVKAATEKRSS